MKMFLSLALALASSGAQAPERAERTRDEVLALPTVEAAETLLGRIASRFVTMTVERNGDVPVMVAFATAPRNTGIAGLCEATVLRVMLVRNEDATAPPMIRSYAVNQVYKVVGEVDGPLGPLDPDEEQQTRLCAAAGPVLAAPAEGARGARFFTFDGSGEFWLPVVALHGAIRRAREGRYGRIDCTRRAMNECRNPQADLAALDMRNLARIEITRSRGFTEDFLVQAYFVLEPDEAFPLGRHVSLEFNGYPLPVRRTSRLDFRYGRTELNRHAVP